MTSDIDSKDDEGNAVEAGFVDAWRNINNKHHSERAARLDAFMASLRPKEIGSYMENGNLIRVFEGR